MGKMTRRVLLAGTAAGAGAFAARHLYTRPEPYGLPYPAASDASPSTGSIVLNDASELSPTSVAKHITISRSPDDEMLGKLRSGLKEARARRQPVAASAARHSMGGQSLPENGLAVTMDQDWLEPDTAAKTYKIAAGARWNTIIKELDRIGYSPAVMQSNNDFGVASTFCVNAHGWPVTFGPFGATVRSLKLMQADGSLVTCSRNENADLFAATMGGYGLTGIITELDVDMVKNVRLEPTFESMPAVEFGTRFVDALKGDPTIQMAYGRMDVALGNFFEEALMITYVPAKDQDDLPPASGSGFLSNAAREVFRRQLVADSIKSLRWTIETSIGPRLSGGPVTRNSLINEPVATLDDGDPRRTDILHEYFVAPSRFAEFVKACQDVIPSSYQQLLNITLRYVAKDSESLLSYATEPRIAAVMLFSQEKSQRGEADMTRMTQSLIERVLDIGGTYYLPYRLHATHDQFTRGYPRAAEFVARKRELDPDLVFRNALWEKHMAQL